MILKPSAEICLPCRGAKFLCGRSYCPIILKNLRISKNIEINKKIIEGSSPPSIFVGRINYPNVRIGPLVPPVYGDTSLYDYPELWTNLRIEEILNFRFSLVRGFKFVNVNDVRKETKFTSDLHEIVLSKDPIDISLNLTKSPSKINFLDDVVPPLGSSALLKNFEIHSKISSDKRIEKIYYDKDLKASNAIIKLYFYNVPVSKITKIFSLGMLGLKKNRKIVPTRWSITTIDDNVSKYLINKIKNFNSINEIRLFKFSKFLNRFVIIFFPGDWMYEWIEAWYPNTTWNLYGMNVEIESDHELRKGKKDYASLGGCYYAVRLSISEYLYKEKRKATVLAIREILPGFISSIGVWFVRENIREILKRKYEKYDNINEALKNAFSYLTVQKNKLINSSYILKYIYFQRKIKEFLNNNFN